MGYLAYFFQRRNTVLVIQAGAILLLISSALTWVTASGLGDMSSTQEVNLSGAEVSDTLTAMGMVGVASGIAATIARRHMRGIIGAVLLGAAAIALLQAIGVLSSPEQAAATGLGEITGTTQAAATYSTGFAVWLGIVGSVLLLFGALGLLLFSPSWEDSRASKKYDRRRGDSSRRGEPDAFDLWDGLSEGDDPTDKGPRRK